MSACLSCSRLVGVWCNAVQLDAVHGFCQQVQAGDVAIVDATSVCDGLCAYHTKTMINAECHLHAVDKLG